MDKAIELCLFPKPGLRYFATWAERNAWVLQNHDEIVANGGKIDLCYGVVRFPNQSSLMLAHGDIERIAYSGYEFAWVLGSDDPRLRSRVRL